jgi:hypothetical protein
MNDTQSIGQGVQAPMAQQDTPVFPAGSSGQAIPGETCGGNGRDEAIRLKAYSFYEARGRADGHALKDWIAAETEVNQPLPDQVGATS